MSFANAVLAVLVDGPQHGYAVHGALRSLLAGVRPVNHGQVYATLERLAREALVTRGVDPSGGATFALTPDGRRALERWLERALGCASPDGELPARLALLAAEGDLPGAARLVAEQRTRCAALERVLATRPDDLVREAALRHVAAERAWLALVEQALCGGAGPICD